MDLGQIYNEDYYSNNMGGIPYNDEHFAAFFQNVAEHIVQELNPRSVLDVGCAFGYLVAALRDRGVDAYGIDVSSYAISQVRKDIQAFCVTGSFDQPLPQSFPRSFDLVTNIEMAEHLEERDGTRLIEIVCRYSNRILFSSTDSDVEEVTHLNVQPHEYWASLFLKNNYWLANNYDTSYISPNAFLYLRRDDWTVRQLQDTMQHLYTVQKDAQNKSAQIQHCHEMLDNLAIECEQYAEEKKILAEQVKELQQELRDGFQQISDLRILQEQTQQQVGHWSSAYNAVIHSFAWKVTKPQRVILQIFKNIAKSGRLMRFAFKVLQSIRRYGIRSTLRKIKHRLSNRAGIGHSAALNDERPEIDENILFSVLVPLYNTPIKLLEEMIFSVQKQTYKNWELCLADGSDDKHGTVEDVCRRYAASDYRIQYKKLNHNLGISVNSNECAAMATGQYLVLLDHDDMLDPEALYENAIAIQNTNAEVLYSDEDKITENGKRYLQFHKPDWSPDLLYCQMYICHLLVISKPLFDRIGGFNQEMDGAQDYDLMLRLSEKTSYICHIPHVLYSWRETEGSTACDPSAKPEAHLAGLRALDAHLKRKYGDGAYAVESPNIFVYEPRFCIPQPEPLVSIIIPMKDHANLTENCITSILEKTSYKNYEILVLDNGSRLEKTKAWLKILPSRDSRIHVYDADFEFNWSKLNNFGMERARGSVYVFLNNDIVVISPDWLEKLTENALRKDIGVVGAQLLYEDGTIQHAGVVVGLNGWADHVFKGMDPIHQFSPFVSPVLNRNVLSVTGACMAISRSTIEQIGKFDDSFIICGSDVEMCIRAYENGFQNLYNANIQLYHLESKSRDTYIPEGDFDASRKCYQPYWDNGDPYFNPNLSLSHVMPNLGECKLDKRAFVNYLKRNRLIMRFYKKLKAGSLFNPDISEVRELTARAFEEFGDEYRINIVLPSINEEHVFGGIATAVQLFSVLKSERKLKGRIIVVDSVVRKESLRKFEEYHLFSSNSDSTRDFQIVDMTNRCEKSIPIAKNDLFLATSWWTAYMASRLIHWQSKTYQQPQHNLIYLIQDFEPGFYSWSSRYILAESTYRLDVPTSAIFNSKELKDSFYEKGYLFKQEYYFTPTMNPSLKRFLETKDVPVKEKLIMVYGRPSTPRNAFEIICIALKQWVKLNADAHEWTIISAGEEHPPVQLGRGCTLSSVGKLSLEDYANLLKRTYLGVSLMISPHPSYPPLEMAAFGAKVITNCFENKALTGFSSNIMTLPQCTPDAVCEAMTKCCHNFTAEYVLDVTSEYLQSGNQLIDIGRKIELH